MRALMLGAVLLPLAFTYQAVGQDPQQDPYAMLKYEYERFVVIPCRKIKAEAYMEAIPDPYGEASLQGMMALLEKGDDWEDRAEKAIPVLAGMNTPDRMSLYIGAVEFCEGKRQKLVIKGRKSYCRALVNTTEGLSPKDEDKCIRLLQEAAVR